MKIYLVNPPAAGGVKIVREGRCMQRKGAWTSVWPPISLALSAAVLEREGHTVRLSDCIVEEIDFDSLREKTKEFSPDLVVINAVTPSLESDLSTCAVVKQAAPQALTAAIGIHPTSLPEDCLALENALDFVVRGEPEMTIRDLAAALKNIKGTAAGAGLAGLSYRDGGAVKHETDRKPVANLDELPFPAWRIIDRSKYLMPFKGTPFLLLATNRGCPYPCEFCADAAYYGKKLRTRSAKSVVDEIVWAKEQFNIDEFLFWSESFTINRAYAIEIANEILRRNVKVSWVCNSRTDNVDAAMLRLFKQAGCWMIGYGVESGNQKMLDTMKKGITLEQIETAVRASKAAGLEVTGHCVIGYPGDTAKTIKETINFVKRLPFDFVQFYCSVPFPGSKLYDDAKKNGWLTTTDWSRYEQNFSVLTTPQLTADEVMAWRSRAYRAFYFRPSLVLQTLGRLRSWKDITNFLGMVKDFLTWI